MNQSHVHRAPYDGLLHLMGRIVLQLNHTTAYPSLAVFAHRQFSNQVGFRR